ncbi:FMN-dependent dehydrogenase-domain-containing protein [Trametes punicea]|nr:FMN-dependent dehydrogenase-domain-containing protein [Trametes punicea]
MANIRVLSAAQVAAHAGRESCWIIVHGKVYDVTDFLDEHPGGSKVILKYAGKDATLGIIDASTVVKVTKKVTEEEKRRQALLAARPPLDNVLNMHDFESVAKTVLPEKAWAYYSSTSDDEITLCGNRMAYQRRVQFYLGDAQEALTKLRVHRVWFRPRILRDVSSVDWSTTILGQKSSFPLYISATALGKLGHPDGELCLTRAAAKHGVIQMIATLVSCSQTFFLQLYVNRDREITKRYVQHAEQRGIKGLFITVDAPQLGRREKNMRMKFVDDDAGAEVQKGQEVKKDQGVARAISVLFITLKGIATAEDAILAYEAGVQGIVLSNHGGRQLDTAHTGLEVLFQIYVDGGVRGASDVLKAIALGAKAVEVGRPFL